MPRFYIEPKNVFHGKFLITDENICNHLRQVLRIRKGQTIDLFDGEGNEYSAEIRYLDKQQVSGVIVEKKSVDEPWPYVILAQALPKAGKADEIVRMCTEVGVSEFVFFESEYSIPKIESYDVKKIERLQRVAIEASRQSERVFMPKIHPAMAFKELLNLDVEKLMLHSRDVDGSVSIQDVKTPQKVLLMIGPEGGFSPKEVEVAAKSGAKIVHLPLPILRTETAGVVAASAILLA